MRAYLTSISMTVSYGKHGEEYVFTPPLPSMTFGASDIALLEMLLSRALLTLLDTSQRRSLDLAQLTYIKRRTRELERFFKSSQNTQRCPDALE